jgi:hypothetical protein
LASWAGLAAKPTAQRSIKEETIFVRLLTLKEREREREREREIIDFHLLLTTLSADRDRF